MLQSTLRFLTHAHRKLRRAGREITNDSQLKRILDECLYAQVGLIDPAGTPYVVPLSFGYRWEKDPIFFFHSARKGRKVEAIANNPHACVSFVRSCQISPSPPHDICLASMFYDSLIAEGKIELITDPKEKVDGLAAIMEHYKQPTGPFNPAIVAKANVYKLIANYLCGKAHTPDN